MAQIEIYTTVTIGGQNFIAGHVHDEKELGDHVRDLKKRDLIGPVTRATRKRLNAEKAAREEPDQAAVRAEVKAKAKEEAEAAEEARLAADAAKRKETGGGASPDETPAAGEK